MKKLTLVLALLLVSSGAFAATETAQMDVYGAFSYVGPPIVPITASYPNTATIFGDAGVDIEWTGVISRFDAPSQTIIDYWAWDETQQFSLLLGEGYAIDYRAGSLPTNPTAVVYTGVEDGVPDADGTMTDMWISLPGYQLDSVSAGGWHWISCPFNHAIPFNVEEYSYAGDNIKVTDGNVVRTVLDAATVEPIWVEEPWSYFQGDVQSWGNAGYLSGVYESDQLEPGYMYMVKTRVDNLALIVPAYPTF